MLLQKTTSKITLVMKNCIILPSFVRTFSAEKVSLLHAETFGVGRYFVPKFVLEIYSQKIYDVCTWK